LVNSSWPPFVLSSSPAPRFVNVPPRPAPTSSSSHAPCVVCYIFCGFINFLHPSPSSSARPRPSSGTPSDRNPCYPLPSEFGHYKEGRTHPRETSLLCYFSPYLESLVKTNSLLHRYNLHSFFMLFSMSAVVHRSPLIPHPFLM
jgi:hypothetical protein